MMPHNHIFKKGTVGYEFLISNERICHEIYIDDIMLFGKNEKKMIGESNNKQ